VTTDLLRFIEAQRDTFERALGEIEAGRKETHWMWFIFPQVNGLGVSPISQRYAIATMEEAEAYLGHPVLGAGYLRLVDAVWHQVLEEGVTIGELFGSPDDSKLVSSLTLFAAVARRLDPSRPDMATFVLRAGQILRAATTEGLAQCATTQRFVAR
jgi:uncharacterized protein (DUF1810 family)